LRKYLIVAISILFAWSHFASGPGFCRAKASATSNKKLLEQATFFMLTKQYFVALPLFEQAVKKDPKSSDAYNGMAWCLHCTGRSDEGMAAGQKAVKLNPKNPYSHQILGAIYFSRGMVDLARTEFRTALVLNPKKRCRGCADLTALLGKDIPPPPPPKVPIWETPQAPRAKLAETTHWPGIGAESNSAKKKQKKPAVVAKKNVKAVKLESGGSADASAAVSNKPGDESGKTPPDPSKATPEASKTAQEPPQTVSAPKPADGSSK
jgi:tetratricopeptide (TPR) repeat protein